ncbi:signal peptidase I [Microlunatus phosphovorus NM-1]|uniref:Signal peptidase I n=1 Tax=Microlunatus phosphovorus (strain ATCC 700054 / DSM 10555 / JCM 9379 / NBRC 101784 / NCIMB 13414 / VKM Ac-1990 / NM-1) TaxID=1032480 RepID=F5XRI8_MICPN|nr:signal peptidase I [Microlunatus phosphovorus]BAK34678.1 signal peptidase I [Microlunatus phosphovorus NM-1]
MSIDTMTTRKRGGSRFGSFVKELLIVVVGALIVSSLLRAFVGQMFIIPSESMENTLLVGDRVVVQKLTDPKRGDVVVFEDPGGWLESGPAPDPTTLDKVLDFIGFPTASSPEHLIKRIIGMPGDHVVCCDNQGRIKVNDQAMDESEYLYKEPDGTQIAPSDIAFDLVVPADRIFVMGDHRDLSADSRCHLSDLSLDGPAGTIAFVPLDKVVGPAFAIAAPFSRAKILHRPAIFDKVPAPTEPPPAQAVIKPAGISC